MTELCFTEKPDCNFCDNHEISHFIKVNQVVNGQDVNLVKCNNCGLIFTSPRPSHGTLIKRLSEDSKGARTIAENRIRYGVSLTKNINKVKSDWRERLKNKNNIILDKLQQYKSIGRLHEVGCGVGQFLYDAKERGISISGNEINQANVNAALDIYGLEIYYGNFEEMRFSTSLDAVVMHDFIEHAFYPKENLQIAYSALDELGLLYIRTFHMECRNYYEKKEDWEMLKWNHVHHFSLDVLVGKLREIGFSIVMAKATYDSQMMEIIARK